MRRKNAEQKLHKKAGINVINILTSIFGIACIQFSENNNKQYGMSEFMTMLMYMIHSSTTAESAGRNLIIYKDIPVGKWFRNVMHTITRKNAELLCKTLLDRTVDIAKEYKALQNGRIYVAIDKHLLSRYDKGDSDNLIGSKRKNGTNMFEAYATIQIVAGKINAIMDCFRFVSGSTNVDFIVGFVHVLEKHAVFPRLMLLDREFYATNVMHALDGLKKTFLMPAVKNDGIKKAIIEYHNNMRAAVSQYTITSKNGQKFTFTLIIRKIKKKKNSKKKKKGGAKPKKDTIESMYIAFATNLSVQEALREIALIPQEYKIRWGIETAYRQIESIRPWTTSKDESYRKILFYTAMYMYNMWAIERIKKGIKTSEMTLQFLAEIAHMILLLKTKRNAEFPLNYDDPG